jgi:hypothetical protein
MSQEIKSTQHADNADLRDADQHGSIPILFCLIRVPSVLDFMDRFWNVLDNGH